MQSKVAISTQVDVRTHHPNPPVHLPPNRLGHGTGLFLRQRKVRGALTGAHSAPLQHGMGTRVGACASRARAK